MPVLQLPAAYLVYLSAKYISIQKFRDTNLVFAVNLCPNLQNSAINWHSAENRITFHRRMEFGPLIEKCFFYWNEKEKRIEPIECLIAECPRHLFHSSSSSIQWNVENQNTPTSNAFRANGPHIQCKASGITSCATIYAKCAHPICRLHGFFSYIASSTIGSHRLLQFNWLTSKKWIFTNDWTVLFIEMNFLYALARRTRAQHPHRYWFAYILRCVESDEENRTHVAWLLVSLLQTAQTFRFIWFSVRI